MNTLLLNWSESSQHESLNQELLVFSMSNFKIRTVNYGDCNVRVNFFEDTLFFEYS